MKSDKFFKWIWNLNGLIILIGILIFAIFIAYQIASTVKKGKELAQPTLNLADDNKNEEKWSLGFPRDVGNTPIYYIPLESEKLTVERKEKRVDYFSGGSYTETRSKNAIFINSVTNDSNWLFKSTEQLILDIKPLIKSRYNSDSVTRGIAYEVINYDTNQDGELSRLDKRTFAISDVDGSNYTEIISGYNRIVKSALNSEADLFVVFVNNEEAYSMVIDMDKFEVLNKEPLPKVGMSD